MFSASGSMAPLSGPSLSLQGNNDEESIPVGTANAAGGGEQRKQPMVELIESNTKLNQDLDQVRKEYKQCLDDMETTKEDTEQLMNEERQSIEEQTQAAIEEEKDLMKELVAIQTTDLVQAYGEEERAKLARDQAQDRLRVAQEMADGQHQKFMEECRMYRINIQRLSCQGECLGIDQHLAPLLACAVLQGPSLQQKQNTTDEQGSTESTGNAADGNPGSEQFDTILASMWEAAGLAATTNDDDIEGDEELEEALRALEEQKASSRLAEEALEEELKKKNTLIEDQEKRDLHKESLKAQFQRLTDDVDKLQSQIMSFQRQSKEATDIALTYQRSIQIALEKREAAAAAAKALQNPYAKRSASAPTTGREDGAVSNSMDGRTITPQSDGRRSRKKAKSSRGARSSNSKHDQRSDSTPTPPGQHYQTLGPVSTQQFPHRSGRVRSSRFGASLRVSTMDILASTAGRGKEKNAHTNNSKSSSPHQDSESEEETFGPSQGAGTGNSADEGGNHHHSAPKRRKSPAIEEDDDEEALFSYVAFPK